MKNCGRIASSNTEPPGCIRIRDKSGKRNRTQSHYETKPIRRLSNNYKTRTDRLHKDTWQIQPTKQPESTKRPGRLPRSTVSAWNTKPKGKKTLEHKLEQSKTMLQMRKSVQPNHLQSCPAKNKIC